MKKIMCLIDGLRLGGAQRQLIGLTWFLRQKGYQADLVTYLPDNFYPDLFSQYGFNPIITPARGYADKLRKIGHLITSGHYDTVITYLDGPASLCCLLKMAGLNFRLIVSERNTTQNLSYKERVKFFLYRFADVIVPNATSQTNYISQHFPHLVHKVHTIHNFTDTRHFRPSAVTQDPASPLTILTPSRISHQKNVLNYLEAIHLVRQHTAIPVRFKWLGNVQHAEAGYETQCLHRVSELHLEDLITFQPASHNILSEYQQADIVCLPSLFEGFPNVVCEAMSCGKPILCSHVCDNSHIVQEGISGHLFTPTSPQSIAYAILLMLSHTPEERVQMGQQARNYAVGNFSEQIFTDKYLQII